MISARFNTRRFTAWRRVNVTIYQPTSEGPVPTTGKLLGEVWAFGKLHHYRISQGEFLLLAPPHWMGVESFAAVMAVGLTLPDNLLPAERMAMEGLA